MEISTKKTKTFIDKICLFHFEYISKVADLNYEGELHKYTFNNTPVSDNQYGKKIKKIYENCIDEVKNNIKLLPEEKIPFYLDELLHDLVKCKKIISENVDMFYHYYNNGILNQRGILQEEGFHRNIKKKERDLLIEDEKTGNHIEINSGYYFVIKTPGVYYWTTPNIEDYEKIIKPHQTFIDYAIDEIKNFIKNRFGKSQNSNDNSKALTNDYKKHPDIFDLKTMPLNIIKKYSEFEYETIDISDFGKTPMPLLLLFTLHKEEKEINKEKFTIIKGKGYTINLDFFEVPIQEYAKGFLEGYNNDLIPFIDNNNARKEKLINEATKNIKGFPKHYTGSKYRYFEKDFYETGIYEGRRYKAWEIIFETPGEFAEFFINEKAEITANLEHLYNWTKLFKDKYGDRNWSVKDVPENANIITIIDLQFNYLEKIIQDTINASEDKQKEINNFLTICDLLISKAKPKCIDPLEKKNKEINEYWLSKVEALQIFVATFERHIPKASTAKPPKEDNDKVETTEQKVRRILAPLKEIGSDGIPILDNDSFEKLATTYINWIVYKKEPYCKDLISIHGLNEEFFTPLHELHIGFNIPYSGVNIGEILNKIIPLRGQRGYRGEPMAPVTIEKYIKNKGKYY